MLVKEEIIFEVLEATGLNYTVTTQPTFFQGEDMEMQKVPNSFTTVRRDTNKPMGVVTNRYTPFQNSQLVDAVLSAGYEMFDEHGVVKHPWNNAETLGSFGNMAGGTLKGGRAVFVQLMLPTARIGKSDIKRFLTGANHHDGTKSVGFGTTNQVVCCANTFAIAYKELQKFRHSATVEERVEEAVRQFRKLADLEVRQMEIFDKASSMSFDNKHVREVMEAIFGKKKLDGKDFTEGEEKKVLAIGVDIEKSIDEQGETLWALFNGVTRFTNHTTKRKNKDYSLMFGEDARINQKAYKLLESWVNN